MGRQLLLSTIPSSSITNTVPKVSLPRFLRAHSSDHRSHKELVQKGCYESKGEYAQRTIESHAGRSR